MKRSTAIIAVTALFLVGILVGVLGTHAFYAWQMRRPGGLAELGLRFVAADLERRLDLTTEQRAQVDLVLLDTRRDLEALRVRTMPDLLAILNRSRARIEPLLTPEQRVAWEKFRAAHRERLERFLRGRS